jgi:hypothetical protein
LNSKKDKEGDWGDDMDILSIKQLQNASIGMTEPIGTMHLTV